MIVKKSSPDETLMFREAAEAAEVVTRQRSRNRHTLLKIGERLRHHRPRAVVTLARGSSDHAATFARYAIERHAGVLTSSASPSISSIYDSAPDMTGTIVLAISQSGKSPDLLTAVEQSHENGAFVVAMVNDEESPLAAMADVTLPLVAGPECSVAASKSFIATLSAILDLLGAWTENPAIGAALDALPGKLAEAWRLDWSEALPLLLNARSMYVVGRGQGFAIAQEAALKLKETCAIHAEAFSAAEVRHGPMALARPGFPVLLFGQPDESLQSVMDLADEFARHQASVINVGLPAGAGTKLPTIAADPLTAPILEIASFYRVANALALRLGRDPDRPPHLAKVTETV